MSTSCPNLLVQKIDGVILATGVTAREPKIPGRDRPSVISCIDVLAHDKLVDSRVVISSAGGIGFDVAEFLVTSPEHSPTLNLEVWLAEWSSLMLRAREFGDAKALAIGAGGEAGRAFEQAPEEGRIFVADSPADLVDRSVGTF
jgi:hypothetical protein